jgi:DNA-directed RNA polymerase specialized sigma24 family protein
VGFEEFYDASRSRCLRAVMACVGKPELAEDLVSEAFSAMRASLDPTISDAGHVRPLIHSKERQ